MTQVQRGQRFLVELARDAYRAQQEGAAQTAALSAANTVRVQANTEAAEIV
jgi:hypothetical protein